MGYLLHFWPRETSEWLTLAVTFGVVAPVVGVLLHVVGFPAWPSSTNLSHLEWERDRVLSVAKGTATSAAGFLTALVVALLKHDVNDTVPGISILGCLAGALGLLLFASQMSLSVRITNVVSLNAVEPQQGEG